MMFIRPKPITSITGGAGAHADYPLANVGFDDPERAFMTTGGVTSTTIVVTMTGPVNAIGLVGVVADSCTLTVGGSAPAGLVSMDFDDAFMATGRTNYWFTFNQLTGTVVLKLTLTRSSGDPDIRAGVVKAGAQRSISNMQYPLNEGIEDSTVQFTMSDGTIYRGAERQPLRTLSGTVVTERGDIEDFVYDCMLTGGRSTLWHFWVGGDDRYCLYGRLAGQPSAAHSYVSHSSASFAVREVL